MEHRHDFPRIGHNRPCPLCGGGEADDLIEQVAADLWNSRRYGTLDDRPWEAAGDYWHRTFRDLAETAVASLKDHCQTLR
ncbi:hypothetical protein [Sphingomonas adhaesiva]|uniref:hypothetical protein n=1 Tax=Sphingomonas adhaesiva TaxID=28212 RepID=UPI002FF60BFD